jgi:hypothetical protein
LVAVAGVTAFFNGMTLTSLVFGRTIHRAQILRVWDVEEFLLSNRSRFFVESLSNNFGDS